VKQIRLLPVVIFAALALLFFKGVGLVTSGGFIFAGVAHAATESADHAPVAEGAEPTITLEPDPTIEDSSPTLEDDAPTLGQDAGEHGAPAVSTATEHSTEVAAPTEAPHGDEAAAPAEGEHTTEAPVAPVTPAAIGDHPAPAVESEAAPSVPDIDAAPAVAEDPHAEGVPMLQDGSGQLVPLVAEDGGTLTENIILERLSARRAELDTREEELNLRLQLVEAAEAQLEERKTALAEIEARINALVDQQKAAEDGQFAAIISMYEQMKPSEAANIFNDLDMQVLVKVAGGMNPRKMAPILAKMNSVRAQQLTLALAAIPPEPNVADVAPAGPQDLSQLPQIVGQ
jgi:flagellar motility protein MotE (MotC chaperone)